MTRLKSLLRKLCGVKSKNKGRIPKGYMIEADYPICKDPDLPFAQLNPLQSCFKDNYDPKVNTVVESGTGSGKTAVLYIGARPHLEEGKRVIVTAPTRELVKSLYRDAINIWGSKLVGINTGNDKDIAEKFFIVTTPEGYNSALRKNNSWCQGSLLVIDEAHNLVESSRGGELDTAMTCFLQTGGKVLLMSGTFPCKKEIAQMLKADLFISNYRRTKINIHEKHVPDDMNARIATKKDAASVHPTINGYTYNRESMRLRLLKNILKEHEGKSVIVFVPTKKDGFCLEESLISPFHCADIEEKEKDRIVAEFNHGMLKTIIATNTLSEGVNTPADIVIVFGTRRGAYYLSAVDVNQMFGRAGRGRDEADVYIIGDKIELFNAKKQALEKTMPIPVESMTLNVLSIKESRKEDVVDMLIKTYAASLSTFEKIENAVVRYLSFLGSCNLLSKKDGKLSLTKEGALLARYYIKPSAYMKYIKAARKLEESTDILPLDKGCILVSCLINVFQVQTPARLEKDYHMKLIPLEMDKNISYQKAASLRHLIDRPSLIPEPFIYQLRDVERWIGMLTDMEKYHVHAPSPGRSSLLTATMRLKEAAARAKNKKKPVQQKLFPQAALTSVSDQRAFPKQSLS